MKAKKITHDRIKKNIIYDKSTVYVYDVPVFYFPKFFHPDPSVERRSGFLQPRLNNNNVLGTSFNLPYFNVQKIKTLHSNLQYSIIEFTCFKMNTVNKMKNLHSWLTLTTLKDISPLYLTIIIVIETV